MHRPSTFRYSKQALDMMQESALAKKASLKFEDARIATMHYRDSLRGSNSRVHSTFLQLHDLETKIRVDGDHATSGTSCLVVPHPPCPD